MRRLRVIVWSTALVMLGSACGGQSATSPSVAPTGAATATPDAGSTSTPGASATSGTLPADLEYVFEIPEDPIAVTPTLDESHAAQALIPIEGGQLTATAADGTIFVLDIPADALVGETSIRMTPLTSIDGMPFGTEPHAVQLEPAGLQFLNYVTLTITPAVAIPSDEQIMFSYSGDDENLILAPPVVDERAIALQLLHFSGAGVTQGTTAQVAAAQPRLGADAEARITSAIAAELGRARQAALLGAEVDPEAVLLATDALLDQFYEQVVVPRIAAAGQSCAAGTLAIQTLLGYERQRALLGAVDEDAGPPVELSLLETVAGVCLREEYERCRDQHLIQNIIPTWLGWARQFALLSGEANSPVLETAAEYVRKCLVFEMRFESQANFMQEGGWDSTVTATFELRYNTDFMEFQGGQAELVNTAFTFTAPGCRVASHPGGGTFNAIDFKYIRETRTPNDMVGYVRDLVFDYNPGGTSESATITCPHSRPYDTGNLGLWSATFLSLHRGEGGIHEGEGGGPSVSYTFTATDWEIFNNTYYAKKEWIKDGRGGTEAGTFKLYHTPE